MSRPLSTRDLRPSERAFVTALRRLRFGRFESLQIRRGELVLEPWPRAIRSVKFGSQATKVEPASEGFVLKKQVVEFFEYVRSVEAGEIRSLEIQNGIPLRVTIQDGAERPGGPDFV